MVRAKFVCAYKSNPNEKGEGHITFNPVYSGSEENQKFFAATPGGQIMMYTVNPSAYQAFEIGKEYYVDFTKAEEAQD